MSRNIMIGVALVATLLGIVSGYRGSAGHSDERQSRLMDC
jgi:hypothetical protein